MTFRGRTTWAEVEPGDLVLGADDHEWLVTAVNGTAVTMEREGREPITGRPPADRVVWRKPGPAALELAGAVAALEARFHVEPIRSTTELVWLAGGRGRR